jgi:hypothetical protein
MTARAKTRDSLTTYISDGEPADEFSALQDVYSVTPKEALLLLCPFSFYPLIVTVTRYPRSCFSIFFELHHAVQFNYTGYEPCPCWHELCPSY